MKKPEKKKKRRRKDREEESFLFAYELQEHFICSMG